MSVKDTIYALPTENLTNFTFDDKVAEVFPDMAQRSIPGYLDIIHSIGMLTARFAIDNSNIYDLGCSLGAATIEIRRNINNKNNCQVIAVDNSEAMLSRCKSIVSSYNSNIPVHFIHNDINNIEIENASIVVLNFVLQFIDPSKRDTLLKKIYNGLLPGGILIISEKFKYQDELIDDVLMNLYWDFKRSNGYSELEISQKRNSLENVLIRDTIETHKERLESVGFKHSAIWHQSFNFGSIIAIK